MAFLCYSRKCKKITYPSLIFNDKISSAADRKYLHLNWNSKLNFNEHIDRTWELGLKSLAD